MQNRVRSGVGVVAVAAALITGVGYGTASASGHSYVKGDGTFALASFNFHGRNTGDQDNDASGYFSAESTPPADAFIAPQGRITCLSVEGNKAGFLYPLEDDTKPGFLKGQVILITLEDGGEGGTDHIGFTGPAPAAVLSSCKPGPTPFEVTDGDVEVHDENDD